ncbi:MAG: glycosyltransferase family 2 protein [Thermaurantimonas sp.]
MIIRPLVSILSVNYNQTQMTIELIESLQKVNYPDIEIVIVDNGSERDLPDPIGQKFPDIKFLKTGKNLGFAGGNNYGLKHCHGELIFFVNNDVLVEPDFLEPLVEHFEKHPRCGMASPRIVYHKPEGLLQYAGTTPLNPYTLRNKGLGYREPDVGQYKDVRQTSYIHGAAMMVPRKVIDQVGLMYEDYFLYYEELDWNERIRKAGYEIWYVGTSQIIHRESVSVGGMSPLKVYYLNRNRLLFARRNLNGSKLLVSWLFYTLVSLPVNSLRFLMKREMKLLKALWKAYFWNLTHSSKVRPLDVVKL